MSKRLSLTALLLSAAMLLSGCGGGDDGATTANATGAGGSGGNGEMVRYAAASSQIRHLDPIQIGDTTSSSIASNIYDTLLQYHYLKKQELVPSLAAEMPEFSDDRKTITVKLRDDVYFHDDPAFPDGEGRKMVAEDIVYSWKRLADIRNAAGNWSFLKGRIVGLDAFREYTRNVPQGEPVDYNRTVEGLQAIDDHTLQIKLTEPWPQIRYIMAHLPTAAVPREAVEHYGEEFINNPVGTGPYMLEQWRRGNKVVLVRNPDYREERYPSEGSEEAKQMGLLADAGEELPFIDRIEVSIIEEDQPYWLTFKNGKIDSAGIPKDAFGQAIMGSPGDRELSPEMKERDVKLQTIDDPSTFWIAFNMEDPVVGENLPLRRALSMAIDRTDYLDLFLNGRGEPARGLFPPVFDVYNSELESPYSHHDPAKARELVEKAREVHGGELPTLELTLGGTDVTSRQTGQYLQRTWQKIGLDVEVETMDWPSLQRAVDNKSAQMWSFGWLADYPDGENFLMLYYGPNASPGPNSTNYDNPEFNELFEKARSMAPGEERTELYRQLEQMVVDDLPNIFTLHRVGFVLQQPWLKNYRLHPWASGTYKYQKIDTQMRQERVGR